MVEGAVTSCTPSLALDSVPFGLAGNGCGGVLGCESARTAASARDLAVGDHRNGTRSDLALGCGRVRSAGRTPSARMGGNVGTHPAPSLRHFPNRRTSLAKGWRQRKSHHVCPTPLHIPRRGLGKALEPWFPPACP